jgi:hypothetical protein
VEAGSGVAAALHGQALALVCACLDAGPQSVDSDACADWRLAQRFLQLAEAIRAKRTFKVVFDLRDHEMDTVTSRLELMIAAPLLAPAAVPAACMHACMHADCSAWHVH